MNEIIKAADSIRQAIGDHTRFYAATPSQTDVRKRLEAIRCMAECGLALLREGDSKVWPYLEKPDGKA